MNAEKKKLQLLVKRIQLLIKLTISVTESKIDSVADQNFFLKKEGKQNDHRHQ